GGWDGDGGSYGTGVGGAAGEEENGSPHLTNLNTASKMELIELPGIGEAYAQRIIAYREEHGPFQSVEDIMNVSGIGEATFAKLKDLITVGQ
ncbi:MAG: ComEA family DNA-binding protein, partial [Lachnospiraceae bacterium]|nr:ComEA family DNA-binding protein [Lachnospiraceae bacterium]